MQKTKLQQFHRVHRNNPSCLAFNIRPISLYLNKPRWLQSPEFVY